MANWYVRKGGSDTNGGSSSSLTPDRQGTDGATTNLSTTFTSLTGAFTAGDVGKGINVGGTLYRIAAYLTSTTVTLDRAASSTASGLTWKIGGALLTVGKLPGTVATIMQNGDMLAIGAGTYREINTLNFTGITTETFITGDVDGSLTGDSGDVILTAYLTNDKTAPSGSNLINQNGKNFITWSNFIFVSGSAVLWAGSSSHDIKFKKCLFIPGSTGTTKLGTNTANFATAMNLTFDQCIFLKPGNADSFTLTLTTGVGADYDANVLYQNCTWLGQGSVSSVSVNVVNSGTSANKGGGVRIRNNTNLTGPLLQTTASQISTSIPCTVNNCLCFCGAVVCLSAGTSGQITEDYNIFMGNAARTNVTAGTHSISDGSYSPLIEIGQALLFGRQPRPFLEPMIGSPILGYGDDGNAPSVDQLNRPRSCGGQSVNKAVGALERGNTWVQETTTVDTGLNAISCIGPAIFDIQTAVDAISTTLSVKLRYDSTYAGSKPQIEVLNGLECGVADAIQAMTGAANQWETVSLTFTPAKKGIVTIRIRSRDTNGGGKSFADTRNF